MIIETVVWTKKLFIRYLFGKPSLKI
jgi:hypothetical protein